VDHGNEGFLFSAELVLGGCAYVLYSTHSHRHDKPKYRLIVLPGRTERVAKELVSPRPLPNRK
jgi:hypothetical protein